MVDLREPRILGKTLRIGHLDVVGHDVRDAAELYVQMSDGDGPPQRRRGPALHDRNEPIPPPENDKQHDQDDDDAGNGEPSGKSAFSHSLPTGRAGARPRAALISELTGNRSARFRPLSFRLPAGCFREGMYVMREQTVLLCLFAALAGPALAQPAAPAGNASSPGGVAAPEAPAPAGEAGPAPSPAQREHTARPIAKPSATGENAARQSLLAARKAIGEGRSQQAAQFAYARRGAAPRHAESPSIRGSRPASTRFSGQVAEARGVVAAGYDARALKLVDAALARLPPRPPHRKAGPG